MKIYWFGILFLLSITACENSGTLSTNDDDLQVSSSSVSTSSSHSESSSSNNGITKEQFKLTLDGLVDSRDDQSYNIVQIGTQLWMAENLNFDEGLGSKCYEKWGSSDCAGGRLYDWSTAMAGAKSSTENPSGVQGLCPVGWHIPSDEEWKELGQTVELAERRAKELSEDEVVLVGELLMSKAAGGSDEYDFSANLGGFCFDTGSCFEQGDYGNYWTSSGKRQVFSKTFSFTNSLANRSDLHSVRCVKGEGVDEVSSSSLNDYSSDSSAEPPLEYDSFIDSRDNQIYDKVKIGEQTWMAENLNYDSGDGSYCFENKKFECIIYGRLYSYLNMLSGEEAQENSDLIIQGICPEGWHIPSMNEYETLALFIAKTHGVEGESKLGEHQIGKYLKSRSNWKDNGEGWEEGIDSHYFAAYAGGYGIIDGNYINRRSTGHWWTSTKEDATSVKAYMLNNWYNDFSVSSGNNKTLHSLRCIEN